MPYVKSTPSFIGKRTASQITALNAAIAAGTLSYQSGTYLTLSSSGADNGATYTLKGVGTAAFFASVEAGVGGVPAQISYSTTIPLDGNKIMPRTQVAGAVALTIGAKTSGGSCRLSLLSDGTNTPSIAGASAWASDFGFDNSQAGLLNVLDVWTDDGTTVNYGWSQPAVNTPNVTPVAPAWSAAPTVTSATQGSPVTFTSGTATGTPTPTITFRTTLDGSPVGTPNAAYTPQAGDVGKSIRIIQTASNSAGTVDSATSAAFTVVASSGVQAEVTSWLARVSSAGGAVSSASQAAANNFVASAKANGYWSKLSAGRLNLFLGDAPAATVPLVNTIGGSVDVFTGVTYAESTGPVGDGATTKIDTGAVLNISTGGISAYLRTTQASDATARVLLGTRDSSSNQIYRILANGNTSGVSAPGNVAAGFGGANAGLAGTTGGMVAAMWHEVRRSSTDSALYKNGVQAGVNNTTITPATSGFPLLVFGNNAAGTLSSPLAAGSAVGAYAIDTGMTAAEIASYYADMQAFQAAMGRSV